MAALYPLLPISILFSLQINCGLIDANYISPAAAMAAAAATSGSGVLPPGAGNNWASMAAAAANFNAQRNAFNTGFRSFGPVSQQPVSTSVWVSVREEAREKNEIGKE